MIRNRRTWILLATSFVVFLASTTVASSRKYKNAAVYSDDSACYVGTWAGTNMAFEPPLGAYHIPTDYSAQWANTAGGMQ